MTKTITPINFNSDTFQTWIDKTNDLIEILDTNILTASLSGDNTTGDATLIGNFTTTNLTSTDTLRTNTIDAKIGNTSFIEIKGQTLLSTVNQIPLRLSNTLGPRLKINNNSISWLAGLRGSSGSGTNAEFLISIEGQSNPEYRFSTDGKFYSNTVIADNFIGTLSTTNLSGILSIANGGTGSSNTAGALSNLGAQSIITGAATTITSSNLSPSRAVVSNAVGKITTSNATLQELDYISGATSNIQTQLNSKLSASSFVNNGFMVQQAPGTFTARSFQGNNGITVLNGNGAIVNVTVTLTGGDLTGVGATLNNINDGIFTTGVYTPSPSLSNFRRIINNGTFTFAAPTAPNDYTLVVQMTNGASANTVTLSNFTKTSGDTITLVNGDKFFFHIIKCNGFTSCVVQALQ
jgi:hypothetical protein